MGKEKVYIVTWEYGDKSGHGIVDVYEQQAMAEYIVKILEDVCDGCGKVFSILTYEVN